MREIRQSGSEGGGTGSAGSPYPYRGKGSRSGERSYGHATVVGGPSLDRSFSLPSAFRFPNSEFRIFPSSPVTTPHRLHLNPSVAPMKGTHYTWKVTAQVVF